MIETSTITPMKISILFLASIGFTAAIPATPTAKTIQGTPWTSQKKAILNTRGGAIVSKDLFLTASKVAFAGYGVQMALVPKMLVAMNFNAPASDMEAFWIRGTSIAIFGFLYALGKMDAEEAFKAMAVFTFAIGCVYPWNARFVSKLDVKEGITGHRFPEILMAVLTVMAAIAEWA